MQKKEGSRGKSSWKIPPKIEKKEERQADADGTRQRSDLDAHEVPPARYARNSEKGGG
jgi:hypothetical protein